MNLICVNPAHVSEIWPLVKDRIKKAIERGGLSSFGPIENNVLAGRALLWIATGGVRINAAAVTELSQTEWRRTCEIVACGGDGLNEWLPLISGLEQYARDEKCSAIRIIGRKGWQRVLEEYTPRRVVLEKELT